MRLAENTKSRCISIVNSIRCIKQAFKSKGIPADVFIKTTQYLREIEKETHNIRRSVWRKKYYRPANIKSICCVKCDRGEK